MATTSSARPRRARTLARILVVAFTAIVVSTGCEPAPPAPEPVARAYATAWSNADYEAMFGLLTAQSQQRAGEDGFTKRLPRIAEEMSLRSLEVVAGAKTHGVAAPDFQSLGAEVYEQITPFDPTRIKALKTQHGMDPPK